MRCWLTVINSDGSSEVYDIAEGGISTTHESYSQAWVTNITVEGILAGAQAITLEHLSRSLYNNLIEDGGWDELADQDKEDVISSVLEAVK